MNVGIFLHKTEVSLDTLSRPFLALTRFIESIVIMIQFHHLARSGVKSPKVLLLLLRQQRELGGVVEQGGGVLTPPVREPRPQPPVVVVAASLYEHLVAVKTSSPRLLTGSDWFRLSHLIYLHSSCRSLLC